MIAHRITDMHDDTGNHQEQVKELMQKTADALDDLALKMLFVSVQRNNLEMCIRYAIKQQVLLETTVFYIDNVFSSIIPLDKDITTVCISVKAKNNIQFFSESGHSKLPNMVWAFVCELKNWFIYI